jgi:signal transduction histidine kinase
MLAESVAHDTNNELTVILSSVAVLLRVTPADDERRPLLADMRDAAMRLAYKSAGLLHFARQGGAKAGCWTTAHTVEDLSV